jgi:hypothetical protein
VDIPLSSTAEQWITEDELQKGANPSPGLSVFISEPDFFERLHLLSLLNSRRAESFSVAR